MIRQIRQYIAISRYVGRLGGDLVRRFGERKFYQVAQVTQAVERGGYSADFIVYAHAAFCGYEDFESHYRPRGIAVNYLGLRRVIARRYFSGWADFDAKTIYNTYRETNDGRFYESGRGISDAGGGHSVSH